MRVYFEYAMKNHRLFSITYHGATNTKPSRVKIRDLRHRKTRWISYDSEFNNTWEMADKFLKSKGIVCDIMGEADDFNAFILGTIDFSTEI